MLAFLLRSEGATCALSSLTWSPAEIKPFHLVRVLSEQQRWDQNSVSWLEGQQPCSSDHSLSPDLEGRAPTSRRPLQGGTASCGLWVGKDEVRDCKGISRTVNMEASLGVLSVRSGQFEYQPE